MMSFVTFLLENDWKDDVYEKLYEKGVFYNKIPQFHPIFH